MQSSTAHPSRLALYARLVRIDKPIGTLLLLWPTLWAMWMAADGHRRRRWWRSSWSAPS